MGDPADKFPSRDALTQPADDACLALRARDGDSDAFAVLVRRHEGIAVRMAALVGGAGDAEDAAQEAFVKAYRALHRYQPDRSFRPWLMAIVCNEARNRQRSGMRQFRLWHRAATLTPMLAEPSAEESVERKQQRAAAVRAVDRLPEKLRLVVTCRYLLELSEAETAEVLGVPTGTVKSRSARGLAVLRRNLTSELAEQEVNESCRPTSN